MLSLGVWQLKRKKKKKKEEKLGDVESVQISVLQLSVQIEQQIQHSDICTELLLTIRNIFLYIFSILD